MFSALHVQNTTSITYFERYQFLPKVVRSMIDYIGWLMNAQSVIDVVIFPEIKGSGH